MINPIKQIFTRTDRTVTVMVGGVISAPQTDTSNGSILLKRAAKIRSSNASSVKMQVIRGKEVLEDDPFQVFLDSIDQRSLIYSTIYKLYVDGVVYWLPEMKGTIATGTTVSEIKVISKADVKESKDGETYTYKKQEYSKDRMIKFSEFPAEGAFDRLQKITSIENNLISSKNSQINLTKWLRLIIKTKGATEGGKAAYKEKLKEVKGFIEGDEATVLLQDPDDEASFLEVPYDQALDQHIELVRAYIASDSGVAGQMLGSTKATTYNNVESFRKHFWLEIIIPELVMLENTISGFFFKDDATIRVKFDMSNIPALRDEDRVQSRIMLDAANTARKLYSEKKDANQIWSQQEAHEFIEEIRKERRLV